MKIIQKTLVLEKKEYYEKHLMIINGLIPAPLSKMEIKVLSSFMSLDGDLVSMDRFNTQARKQVSKELNISAAGMSNYIRSLQDKGAIFYNITSDLEIARLLRCEDTEQFYQFKITKA